jgi:hypothetical protein
VSTAQAASESDSFAPVPTNSRTHTRQSALKAPDSVPSLRALEVASAPARSKLAEPAEAAELADEDRTPAGILVDRATLLPRSRPRRTLAVASASAAVALSVALGWRFVANETRSEPMSAPTTAQQGSAESQGSNHSKTPSTPPESPPAERAPLAQAAPPTQPEAERVAEPAVAPSGSVAYDAQRLEFALRYARSRAQQCHQGGRAIGTAALSITFSSEGKVSELQLSGEPIASAPVGVCVAGYFRSMLIPAFEGEAFTIHELVTLR